MLCTVSGKATCHGIKELAALLGHEQVLGQLLQLGFVLHIDECDDTGYMALMWACGEGHEKVVQMLLEKGQDVNAHGGKYGSALQAASARGHETVVQMLLEKGADVNAHGGKYGSALQAASVCGHENVVRMLINAGVGKLHTGNQSDDDIPPV